MKIAIIGTGISGLGAAYLLAGQHSITVFEKNNYIGGHTRTIDVKTGTKPTAVDTGFIVFNNWNYPNLMGLFQALDVPFQKSDMSFGVSINNAWLEYGSSGLFAQKRNLLARLLGMLRDILRFNKQAYIPKNLTSPRRLPQCLNMGDWFGAITYWPWGFNLELPSSNDIKIPAKTFYSFQKPWLT